jgi:hypothetical protein
MEPIKINIEVSLSEATIAALQGLFGTKPTTTIAAPAAEPKKAAPVKAKPESKPAPVAVAEDDDLPPDNAPDPAPKKVPTEAEMRAAIKQTTDRGVSAKTVRNYIQSTFNVPSSVDCPPARRQELIDGLAKLSA